MADMQPADLSPEWRVFLAQQAEANRLQREELALLRGSQPPRVIQYGDPDYQAKLAKETKVFLTPTFQNNIEADPASLSDDTINRIPQLKPGRYLGGYVEVQVTQRGAVNFRYSNKTPDQRMAQARLFTSFADLVDKIWDEQQQRAHASVA